jgi:hypothetical protein
MTQLNGWRSAAICGVAICGAAVLGAATVKAQVAGQVTGLDELANIGPRQSQCDSTAEFVSKVAGQNISRRYGPRYFIDLPRVQDRYNGITVFCGADLTADTDQIEVYTPNRVVTDKMLPLIGSIGGRYTKQAADSSAKATSACLSKTRTTRDPAQVVVGKLKINCRTSNSGEEVQIQRLGGLQAASR